MNFVGLIGRLTRDPEIRWTQGQEQKCISRFTLAVDRHVKQTDQNQQTADFISCVAWGKTAEVMEKHCVQGMKLGITGRIQTGSYTNRDGVKIYTTDVVVSSMEFVESKRNTEGGAGGARQRDHGADQRGSGRQESEGFMNIPDGVEDEGLPFN